MSSSIKGFWVLAKNQTSIFCGEDCDYDLLIVEHVQSKFFVEGKLLDTLPASEGILGKIFINIVLTRQDFNENKDYIHNKR